jgi:hypothetical protein
MLADGTNMVDQYLHSIVSIFDKVNSTYELNLSVINQCDREIVDLEHEIELAPDMNASEGYKAYKELRDVRRKRRTAKEENELLKDTYEFFQQNNQFRNKVTQIQGTTRKVFESQQRREYMPRVRNDLTITSQKAERTIPFEDLMSDWKKNKARMGKDGKLVR